MKRFIPIITMLILSVATAAWSQELNKATLRVGGAGMAADQVNEWGKKFVQANPNTNIVVAGSSAGKGFQSLLEGTVEVAMMSRSIRDEERKKAVDKNIKLSEQLVGQAGVAVITHQRNPVNELTLEQIKKIYTGVIDNWKQVGGPDEPIRCVTRRIPESGGAVFFWEKVLEGEPFSSKAVLVEGWETILKICSTAQDLPIGISPHTKNFQGIKIIAVKRDESSPAILPQEKNIRDKTYPISLPFSLVWDSGSNNPLVSKFIEFCQNQGTH
jgi:phosphate transport system substrate-binding protein